MLHTSLYQFSQVQPRDETLACMRGHTHSPLMCRRLRVPPRFGVVCRVSAVDGDPITS